MASFSILGGTLKKYKSDGSYRGLWEPTDDTPEVGDNILYWRCGDDNSASFNMPEVGGTIIIRHARDWGKSFALAATRFEVVERCSFTAETAVGDTPDSWAKYKRVQ